MTSKFNNLCDSLSARQCLTNFNSSEREAWQIEPFVLNFNLFPQTAHEFICDGLYAAYWQSPAPFRARVLDSFINLTQGPFGHYVAPEIWTCLKEPPKGEGL
jgi:hypothetical protein